MKRFVVFVVVAASVGLFSACGSSSRTLPQPIPSTTTSVAASSTQKDALEFRVVRETIPYTAKAGRHCLPDRRKTSCYILGPVLLNGHSIASATAVVVSTTAGWIVNIHFANDDFVTKVATPEVGKQIAVVFDGVVQSAPRINPGITGQDISISGEFTGAEARALAQRLS